MKNNAVGIGILVLASGMAGWVAGMWEAWRYAASEAPYTLEGWNLSQNITGISAYGMMIFLAIFCFHRVKKWEGEK